MCGKVPIIAAPRRRACGREVAGIVRVGPAPNKAASSASSPPRPARQQSAPRANLDAQRYGHRISRRMTIVVPSSSAEIMADPQRFLDELRRGRIISLTDLGYMIAPTAEIVGLADELAEEELLEEM